MPRGHEALGGSDQTGCRMMRLLSMCMARQYGVHSSAVWGYVGDSIFRGLSGAGARYSPLTNQARPGSQIAKDQRLSLFGQSSDCGGCRFRPVRGVDGGRSLASRPSSIYINQNSPVLQSPQIKHLFQISPRVPL